MSIDRGVRRSVLRRGACRRYPLSSPRKRPPQRPVHDADLPTVPLVTGPPTVPLVAATAPAPSAARPAGGRRRRALRFAVPAAAGVLVVVQAGFVAGRLPATAVEAQLVDAAVTALRPTGSAPATAGLDTLAARVQLSAYADVTGAFDRWPTALEGARELGVLACAVLIVAIAALARSLGVRAGATALVLGVLAAVPTALAAFVTVGPGLLGAVWLTLGAALLAQRRPGLRLLGLAAAAAGVVSAPVLAVTVLVAGSAVLVALRRRWNALVLGAVVAATVLPLALLPAPAGPAAVPVLLVVAVLVGLVFADETLDRMGRWRARHRQGRGHMSP